MTLSRGRLIRRPRDLARVAVPNDFDIAPRGRLLEHRIVEANERARTVLDAAERRARTILEDAEQRATDARLAAEERGRADGIASVAALAIRLEDEETRADERARDRTIELAKLLAERLLGHVLETKPEEIAALARQALTEARGARRIVIRAHPVDATLLRDEARGLDADGRVHSIVDDGALRRGDLRLETEIGAVEARLGPEIAHLAARLREMRFR